jgi:23S rRNA (cytosine1962-C5)-methyltransferase
LEKKGIEVLKILAMHQEAGKYLMFRNRLEKVYKHLKKQAVKQGVSCFRVYDHDIPEFPFLVEVYESQVYVSEYKRNHSLAEEEYHRWLNGSVEVMSEVLGVPVADIHIRMRKRKESRADQYQKNENEKVEFVVEENGLKFIVNLTEYLDTGLFLDHRITRQMVRERCAGKKILNLFCYTGSFSVYAIAGGASAVHSVDLSKTYLTWTERNVKLNFPDYPDHTAVHADVLQYLNEKATVMYDIIILDPPTFSNSKRMEEILDIQRDHVRLINQCIDRLSPNGSLYFSTNFTKFKIDANRIDGEIKDITRSTIPFDFAGKLNRRCFMISK